MSTTETVNETILSEQEELVLENRETEPNGVTSASAVACEEATEGDSDAPDGGWGWVITIASFISMILATIPQLSFGILYSRFLLDLGTSTTMTAWINNLALVLSGCFTYLLSPLVNEFGWRKVGVVASLVYGVGIILSAFATSAWSLLFSFSLLVGSTAEVVTNTMLLVVPHYFHRWRSVANAIMMSGPCAGQILMPPLITFLQEEYSYKGATLIIGALALNCCAAAMVFHPIEWHCKKSSTHITSVTASKKASETKDTSKSVSCLRRILSKAVHNMRFLKSPSVVLITLILAIGVTTILNVFTLVPFAMERSGFSQQESSLCLSVAGGCNLIARMITALLSCLPRLRARPVFLFGTVLMAGSIIGFGMVDTLTGKVASMGLCGAGFGLAMGLYGLLMVDELGLTLLLPSLSITGLMAAVSYFTLGPLIGVVRDVSDSYVVALCFCAGCLLVTAVLGLFTPAAHALQRRMDYKQRKNQPIPASQQRPQNKYRLNKYPLLEKRARHDTDMVLQSSQSLLAYLQTDASRMGCSQTNRFHVALSSAV